MTRFKIIALLALLASSGTAHSSENDSSHPAFWEGSGWTVYSYPEEEMCEVAVELVNGESFTFAYFPLSKAYSLLLTNKNATSLKNGDDGKPVIVAGVNLENSAEAILHLKDCGLKATNLNAKDPFLK